MKSFKVKFKDVLKIKSSRKMKKLSIKFSAIAFCLCTAAFTSKTMAQTIIDQGNCGAQGNNLTWVLTSDSVLTISGIGAMDDYNSTYPPWSYWAYYQNRIKTVIIDDGVETMGIRAFADCPGLTSVTIGNNVTIIGKQAFGNCPDLTSVSIGNSVTEIGVMAFYLCSSLTSVTFPNSVTIIRDNAFDGCSDLASVTIPDSVTEIPTAAFLNCSSLTSVTIGYNVNTIGPGAFCNCTSLTSITSHAVNAPYVFSHLNALFGVPTNIPVSVPCASSYVNNSGWHHFDCFRFKPEICMVSVNENNQNVIVWKKEQPATATFDITEYTIVRESSTGQFGHWVANVAYEDNNMWVDTESNAKNQSYCYKIYAKDSCGVMQTTEHRTMHLSINAGINNSWNLIWTPYEGIEYSTYNIYRIDGTGNWTLLNTMPGNNTSYSDFTAPAGYVYYVVEIVLDNPCTLHKSLSSIRSNVATNNPNVGVVETHCNASLRIYPNPTTGELRIKNEELREGAVIEIFDVVGRILMSIRTLDSPETVIDVSHLENGMYFLKVNNKVVKFVKE